MFYEKIFCVYKTGTNPKYYLIFCFIFSMIFNKIILFDSDNIFDSIFGINIFGIFIPNFNYTFNILLSNIEYLFNLFHIFY